MAAGHLELDLGLDLASLQADSGAGGGPLAITSTRMSHRWAALGHAALGQLVKDSGPKRPQATKTAMAR
jgi:hypothetical protein